MDAHAAARREMRLALGTFLALVVVVLGIYGRVLDAPFIFDDRPAITDNPSITRLWPLIGDARQRGPLNPPGLAPTARRPLPNLSFALNYHFDGLRPAGYRLVNLLLHVLTAAVLAALVRRTLRLPYFGGAWERTAGPVALAVALVWAVHPLTTEAVVYITQRTELLAALFYLTGLWAALRHWTASSRAARATWLAVATAAGLAGMASKEIVASLPLVVLLYEWTFLLDARLHGVATLRVARRSWPLYCGLGLGWGLLLLLNLGGAPGLTDARHHVSLPVWWLTQTKVLFLYLKLAVWPWPLSIHYTPTYLRTAAEVWPWVSAAVMAGVATFVLARRRPALRFVVVVMVLVLAPTMLVPLPKMVAAERRMYLPLAGFVTLALVGGYRWLAARWPSAAPRLAVAAVTALVLLLGGVSVRRLAAYDTAVTIWQDAVRQQPGDAMAHYNLGVALLDEGRPPVEAMACFERALALDPEHTGALDNLGMVLNRLGRSQDAVGYLEQALRLDPGDAVAHNNLGIAFTNLDRSEEATTHLQRALVLEPDEPKAKVHLNLGNALLKLGSAEDAIAHFEQAIRLAPAEPDGPFNLGVALLQSGRSAEAIPHFERVLRLAPDDPEAANNLGSALLQTGQPERAVETFRRALALRPDSANLHSNLGTALLVLGRIDDAILHFEAALRLRPDHDNARLNLDRALLQRTIPPP